MALEPSYTENELRRVGAAIHLSGYLDRVIILSTPDSRLQAIVDAWTETGPNPGYHRKARHRLAREWPTLYLAIRDAFTEEGRQ